MTGGRVGGRQTDMTYQDMPVYVKHNRKIHLDGTKPGGYGVYGDEVKDNRLCENQLSFCKLTINPVTTFGIWVERRLVKG